MSKNTIDLVYSQTNNFNESKIIYDLNKHMISRLEKNF